VTGRSWYVPKDKNEDELQDTASDAAAAERKKWDKETEQWVREKLTEALNDFFRR
jgi:hypothetical protein